jgi:type IV pilus assembly protein PilV
MVRRLIHSHNPLFTVKSVSCGAKRGFALLEILLALLLFSAGLVAIAGLYGTALDSGQDAEQTSIAVNLAQKRMEEIRNLSYASIVNESKTALVSPFTAYSRSVTAAELMNPVGLKQVTVTVYWNIKGRETSISLVTYVSQA